MTHSYLNFLIGDSANKSMCMKEQKIFDTTVIAIQLHSYPFTLTCFWYVTILIPVL